MTGAEALIATVLGTACLAGLGWWKSEARGRIQVRLSEDLEQQIRVLRQHLASVEEAATHDPLTGTWNRRRFEEAAAMEMGLVRRRSAPVSLILLDLDHFKRVNDAHGHAAGDTVLSGAATAFRQALRASDALVRWGGEEFIVLSPATGLEGAVNLADRIRTRLESTSFPGIGSVTLSAGVAEHVEGESLEAWVGRADQALYRAKDEGRNRVVASAPPRAEGASDSVGLLEVVWNEAFASGHRFIDTQHQRLFELASLLLSGLVEGVPVAVVDQRMESLLTHTAQHFQDEERLLGAAGYPDLDRHGAEHARLLAAARELGDEVKAGRVDTGGLVAYLVKDLVKGHILTEDCHYFTHLTASLGKDSRP